MSLEDYFKRKGPTTLISDTMPPAGAAAATPATDSRPDLTNRLLQIMSGKLGGTLSSGDKLSALGALLKSVSRGSQTTPQQVMQSIQQQKMAEVQGALQIQQLRQQAQRQAQLDALKAEYIANAPNPQAARELQLMSSEDFSAFLRDRNKASSDEYLNRLATYERLKATDPARAKVSWDMINRPQVIGSLETGLERAYFPEPNLGGQTEEPDPELIAEAKRRGII